MRYAHEVGKVRAAEAALMARLPEGALMQRAAAGLAAVCAGLLPSVYGARVVLLAGGGDNGGDALYAGARLAGRGARVVAVQAGSKLHEGGLAALRAAGGRLLNASAAAVGDEIAGADLIIDGLTGIGGTGGLREPHATLARLASEATGTVVACDVPSGVDAGSGRVEGAAVRADVTVTFGTYKPGLLIDPGAARAGVVELVDIGLGGDLPDPDVVAARPVDVEPPEPGAESDKYRRGVAGIVAGGDAFTGAAVLSVGGAVHGGAGMVRFASVAHPVELVRQRWPEAVATVIDPGADRPLEGVGRVQAWVVGPGLGTGEAAERLLAEVLGSELPALVDADGLTVLARRRDLLRRAAPTVLTPHAGELSRLTGAARDEIEARRLEHVRRAAAELSATVLLKGSTTLIAEEDRPVRVNPTGTPRLATAGTGDVLSGLIGALLAGGMAALDAAAAGAYLHGLAARLASDPAGDGESPISAFDVITALPAAFRAIA
ncbi:MULTISPECIES: NAD(P)H-hydrate dehydratase [Actinomadura]|uniref:Bifunctional NAD(P)H-hydrate repair enzyme n=1 Tax=Actinomadura yumaensis TaxID=111807 RepID=A0ABW2CUC7_9ACTN|nr:NAD(P)H-hydrate dehydratase [Actinomadura sp. J1-007]MWK35964.1 NAD(P)H-hydrate dehydratase [Actinomadura sp. J1-007]